MLEKIRKLIQKIKEFLESLKGSTPTPTPTPVPTPTPNPPPKPPSEQWEKVDANPLPAGIRHVESGGRLSFKAEKYSANVGFEAFKIDGVVAMRATGGAGSRLDYAVQLSGGRYAFHLRARATTHTNNGLQIAFNGNILRAPADHKLAGADGLYLKKTGWSSNNPEWQKGDSHSGPVYLDLPAGAHTFSILKRKVEDPFIDVLEFVKQ
jgi:hypothetical protein